MSDEQWLREGLADAVPEPPHAPDRPDRAKAQARRARRTTTLAIGGAAFAVIAAVGLGAALQGDDGGTNVATTPPPGDPLAAPACPAEPVDAQAQTGPGTIPDGALSVRLCLGNGGPIDVPADALTTMVDELAASVNDLEKLPANAACTMELGPGYQLVFSYSGGKQIVASGELYGCRQVVVDGVARQEADVPLQRFADLLRRQRGVLEAPDATGLKAPDCNMWPTARTVVGRAQELAVAAVCVETSTDGTAWRRADVTATDLAVLRDDVATHTKANAGVVDCGSEPPFPTIVGLTAWGDEIFLPADCGASRFVVDDETQSVWTPGPDAAKVIDRLVAAAR